MAVGDKYFFIGDRVVAIVGQPISIGDMVICMKYNGGLINPFTPSVGDTVLLTQTKSGKVVLCSIVYDDYIYVTSAWSRDIAYWHEIVDIGNFVFRWSGEGSVYLSSVPDIPTNIHADDGVKITTAIGTLSFDYDSWGGTHDGLPNITSICQNGYNNIQIYIYDLYGNPIACSDIYIMSA